MPNKNEKPKIKEKIDSVLEEQTNGKLEKLEENEEIIEIDNKDLRFECINLAFDYLQETENIAAIFLLADRIYKWIIRSENEINNG